MSLFQVAWAGLIPWGGLMMGKSAADLGVHRHARIGGGDLRRLRISACWLWARGAFADRGLPASEGRLY